MQASVTYDPSNSDDKQRAIDFINGAAATTAPAPAATTAPAPAATTAPPGTKFPVGPASHDMTDLDSNGRPWDPRIHAKTKTKTKDETWKYGKGLQKDSMDLINHVNAELDALGGPAPAPAPAPAAPGTPAPVPPQVLEPAFQAIVDKQTRIIEGSVATTPGSFDHYKIPADSTNSAALIALYAKWECQTIDDIYTKGAECWAAVMPCLDYIWAE